MTAFRKKALMRREQDPEYGWLNINTMDFRVDSKLSKYTNSNDFVEMRRMKQISLYNYIGAQSTLCPIADD